MTEQQSFISLNNGSKPEINDSTKKNLMTTGSVLGALAMSSCCIAPLVLFSLGISGAWIGNLTVLYPYKPLIFIITLVFLAGGFYKVYRKPALAECEEGSYCASPISDRLNKLMLWSASLLVLAAMIFPYIAPILLNE